MNNGKYVRSALFALLCILLLFSVSCRKNTENSTGGSEEALTSSSPVETTASLPEKTEVAADSDEIFSPSPVVSVDMEKETEEEDEVTIVVPQEETAKEEKTQVAKIETPVPEETSLSEEEHTEDSDGVFYEGFYSYNGYESYVTVTGTRATLTFDPDIIKREDIDAVAALISSVYPSQASLITYSVYDDTVTLNYPEQSEEYLLSVLAFVSLKAEEILDMYPLTGVDSVEEITVEETPSEEHEAEQSAPVYSETLGYMGYLTTITVYDSHAELTIPSSITYDDILFVVSICNKEYSEASCVTYEVDDGVLYLYYPAQSESFLIAAVKALAEKAVAVIDSLFAEVRTESTAEIEEVQVSETTSPVTVSDDETPLKEEKKEIVETALDEDKIVEVGKTEIVETPLTDGNGVSANVPSDDGKKSSDVSVTSSDSDVFSPAPSSESTGKGENIRRFSVSAVFRPKLSFKEGWPSPFVAGFGVRTEAGLSSSFSMGIGAEYDLSAYMIASLYARWIFARYGKGDFYLKFGGGAAFGIAPNAGQAAFFAELTIGAQYRIKDSFSLFGEVTGEWSKITGPAVSCAFGAAYRF